MVKSRVLSAVGIVTLAGSVAGVLAAQTPTSPAFEVASSSQPAQRDADNLVRQLAHLPSLLLTGPPNDIEQALTRRSREVYREIQQFGDAALPALSRGLRDPNVHLRQNVAAFLVAAGVQHFQRTDLGMDIQPCLPALIEALGDSDQYVRARAAEAIETLGANGTPAVFALITLLQNVQGDALSRSFACQALGRIGPAARDALPALSNALGDSHPQVRRAAQFAVEQIQEPH